MKSGCFGCDAVIEADDVASIEDRFIEHAARDHEWDYPEQALRNYARNVAEAGERLTGPTGRLVRIGEVDVHPVTENRLDDWIYFFDHDAFSDNPDWASCYCLEPHEPPPPDNPERPWRETREMMMTRLRTGGAAGYLAYVDGKAAGWVNASTRSDYKIFETVDPDGPDPSSVIGVSCFVIAPPFRRHGVARILLNRVIADARGRGAAWVEAYPRNDPDDSDGAHFRGPRAMYDARGFEEIEIRERDTVVRIASP